MGVRIKIPNELLHMNRDVIIFQNYWDKNMMQLPKKKFKIEKRSNYRILLNSRFVHYMNHLGCTTVNSLLSPPEA